jgi:hypothetical protein
MEWIMNHKNSPSTAGLFFRLPRHEPRDGRRWLCASCCFGNLSGSSGIFDLQKKINNRSFKIRIYLNPNLNDINQGKPDTRVGFCKHYRLKENPIDHAGDVSA